MATPFDDWTIDDAHKHLEQERKTIPTAKEAARYYEGDHWQEGAGWAGPTPLIPNSGGSEIDARRADTPTAITAGRDINADTWAQIRRGFVSRNVIAEVVDRHVDGVLGRRHKWRVVLRRPLGDGEQPREDEQTLIDEAEAVLEEWIEERRLDQDEHKAAQVLLYGGRAALRLFVPSDERAENGEIPIAPVAESMRRIYLHAPPAGQAMIHTHPNSQRRVAIYAYRDENEQERAEISYLDGEQTILRVLGEDSNPDPAPLALGRRLTMFEMQRPSLIGRPVIQQQKSLNLAYTMLGRNVVLGGFLERVLLNAQVNGRYERAADGSLKYVIDEIPIGAGKTTNVVGIEAEDALGRRTVTQPDVKWRDPVPVGTFADSIDIHYAAILGETNQMHYLIAGDAAVSGYSRETAMSAHLTSLLRTKQSADRSYSWALETALTMAALFAGEPGRYAALRVAADASVDPGPISAEMIRVTADLYLRGLLDLQTALEWIGVEDPDQVKRAIEAEADEKARRDTAAAAQVLINAQTNANSNGAGVTATNGTA